MIRPAYVATLLLIWPVVARAQTPAAEADGKIARDVLVLRTATLPYHTLASAVAAGYRSEVKECLVHEHHGAMGFHHVNAALMDSIADLEHPEILLYERTDSGEYRLNGVEYIVPYRAWPREGSPPVIFGQNMLREDNLRFWYLHVWAWKDNPEGLFANFHPDVRCSADTRKIFRPSE